MTKFSDFTDEELDAMAEAFVFKKLSLLAEEIRKEKESRKGSESNKSLCDFCTAKRCMFQSARVIKHCDFYKSGK